MTGVDGEPCRIRDVVRNSKIRWDIQSKFDRKFEVDYNRQLDSSHYGRVFPRSFHGDDSTGLGQTGQWWRRFSTPGDDRRSIVTEANRRWIRLYIPVFSGTSNRKELLDWVDTTDQFFEEIQPPEDLKCESAYYAFEGEAEQWWRQLQHQKILGGESEIKIWPWIKFLLFNDFRPAMCSTKCPPQNYNGSQSIEEHVKEMIDDSFSPANCSRKVINQQSKQHEGEEMVEHLIVDTKCLMKSSFESHSNKQVRNEADLYELQVKADVEIQDFEVVEGLSEEKDDKQPEVVLDAFNKDGASFHHSPRSNLLRGNISPWMHTVIDFGSSIFIPNGYCKPICVEFAKFKLDQSKESITGGLEAKGRSNKRQKIVLQEAFDPNLVDLKHAVVSISRKFYINARELPYFPNVPIPRPLFRCVILFGGTLSYLFDPGGNRQSNSQWSWKFIYMLNIQSLNMSNFYATKYPRASSLGPEFELMDGVLVIMNFDPGGNGNNNNIMHHMDFAFRVVLLVKLTVEELPKFMGFGHVISQEFAVNVRTKNDRADETYGLFRKLKEKGVQLGSVTQSIVMNMCASIGPYSLAEELIQMMKRGGCSFFRAYTKGSKYKEAESAFALMELVGNISTSYGHFNILMLGYTDAGLLGGAEVKQNEEVDSYDMSIQLVIHVVINL